MADLIPRGRPRCNLTTDEIEGKLPNLREELQIIVQKRQNSDFPRVISGEETELRKEINKLNALLRSRVMGKAQHKISKYEEHTKELGKMYVEYGGPG